MNRVDRGSLLLTLAGLLLLVAVVAYLINGAENNLQWTKAALHSREALRVQVERAIADRKALQAETDRTNAEQAKLHSQQDAIIKSLKRIEEALETTSSLSDGR